MSPDLLQSAAVDARLKVLDGVTLHGSPNIADDTMAGQIALAIRRGWPQARPEPEKGDRIVLVGGGPSLAETVDELRDAVFAGAICVTLNGAYQWCLDHNIQPRIHIVMDGRPSTARFVTPVIPRCKYFVASQCHPAVFDALAEAPETYIFHAVTNDGTHSRLLDAYYGAGHWCPVMGGTTVATRAIALLRMGGYLRYDLFGIDSCWLGGAHHAFDQPENAADRRYETIVAPTGHPDLARTFHCAPWHLKQLEDFLQVLRFHGHQFHLTVHGRGLLAHALTAFAQAGDVDVQTKE